MKDYEEMLDMTEKVLAIRQDIKEVIVGKETEPAYYAVLEILSEIICDTLNPVHALGNATLLLGQYIAHHKKAKVVAVEVDLTGEGEGNGHEPPKPIN